MTRCRCCETADTAGAVVIDCNSPSGAFALFGGVFVDDMLRTGEDVDQRRDHQGREPGEKRAVEAARDAASHAKFMTYPLSG